MPIVADVLKVLLRVRHDLRVVVVRWTRTASAALLRGWTGEALLSLSGLSFVHSPSYFICDHGHFNPSFTAEMNGTQLLYVHHISLIRLLHSFPKLIGFGYTFSVICEMFRNASHMAITGRSFIEHYGNAHVPIGM